MRVWLPARQPSGQSEDTQRGHETALGQTPELAATAAVSRTASQPFVKMVPMITNASSTRRANAELTAEQLSLLPNDAVTARFRLSRDTRERGLRHVAEIRRMLAERAGSTGSATTGNVQALRPSHERAA